MGDGRVLIGIHNKIIGLIFEIRTGLSHNYVYAIQVAKASSREQFRRMPSMSVLGTKTAQWTNVGATDVSSVGSRSVWLLVW